MYRLHLLRLLLLCLLTSSCAVPQLSRFTPSGKVPGAGKPQVYKNLRYADKPESLYSDTSSDRMLDLYMPATKEKLPVFLFIHGGGFSGGDKYSTSTEAICSKLASLGYAVISMNYRLRLKHKKVAGASATANMSKGLPENGQFHPDFREAVYTASEDAQLALKWIKENASKYHLNKKQVTISGGSAGAMTALFTAYVSGQKILPIKAVVNLWGGLENADVIKKNSPRMLTYHGDQDKTINVQFAYALHSQMQKVGNESVLRVIEGQGHAMYKLIAKEKTEEINAFLKGTLK